MEKSLIPNQIDINMSQISHKQLLSNSPGQAGTGHQKPKLDLNARLALGWSRQ